MYRARSTARGTWLRAALASAIALALGLAIGVGGTPSIRDGEPAAARPPVSQVAGDVIEWRFLKGGAGFMVVTSRGFYNFDFSGQPLGAAMVPSAVTAKQVNTVSASDDFRTIAALVWPKRESDHLIALTGRSKNTLMIFRDGKKILERSFRYGDGGGTCLASNVYVMSDGLSVLIEGDKNQVFDVTSSSFRGLPGGEACERDNGRGFAGLADGSVLWGRCSVDAAAARAAPNKSATWYNMPICSASGEYCLLIEPFGSTDHTVSLFDQTNNAKREKRMLSVLGVSDYGGGVTAPKPILYRGLSGNGVLFLGNDEKSVLLDKNLEVMAEPGLPVLTGVRGRVLITPDGLGLIYLRNGQVGRADLVYRTHGPAAERSNGPAGEP